jgi:dUTP pyrophosphatase
MPERKTKLAVGYDLYAPLGGSIDPLSRLRIPLGFQASFTPGWAGLLLDRSGMGNKGITRFAGVIDPDYPDEWQVILFNSTGQKFSWEAGDRLIQVVFVPAGITDVLEVSTLENRGDRVGGFGSTGV